MIVEWWEGGGRGQRENRKKFRTNRNVCGTGYRWTIEKSRTKHRGGKVNGVKATMYSGQERNPGAAVTGR